MKTLGRRLGWFAASILAVLIGLGGGIAAVTKGPLPGALSGTGASSQGDLTAVFVELVDAPAAETYAAALKQAQQAKNSPIEAAAEARAQLGRIETAQRRFLDVLDQKHLNALVIYRTQRILNGVALLADSDAAAAIRNLPGVAAVRRLTPKRVLNSTSVPFIHAAQTWDSAGLNATGQGVRIGIIDTGVDYIHADFGGSGLEATYSGNDPSVIGDVPFPTTKVVGGVDLAGETYDADVAEHAIPEPDPDPMDCDGHGTHVAATAAGYGVRKADSQTYTGPYGPGIDFSSFEIGPGTAPEADIYAIKVFGCSNGLAGTTVLDIAAIEWATDPDQDGDLSDHLDVINLSLGSTFGISDDPSLEAIEAATVVGIAVVMSAGNSADSFFVTSSPGVAPNGISVAAASDDGRTFQAMLVNTPESIVGICEAGIAEFGPPLTPEGVTAEVVYAQPYDACTFLSNVGAMAGKIALIDRGTCFFTEKVLNAEAAGAVAAIIVNNQDGPPITMAMYGEIQPSIPSIMITKADGQIIKDTLPTETVEVTISSETVIVRPDLADTVAEFTSRGPTWSVNGPILKPDVTAPGVDITSAELGTGTEGIVLSGTSMAAPHIAGVIALLREVHPNWSVAKLKALLMNTALYDLYAGAAQTPPVQTPARIGAGRVDALSAASSAAIAYDVDHPGQVSVSFATREVADTTSEVRTVRVESKGNTSLSFDIAIDTLVDAPGVSFTLAGPATITVPAQGFIDVPVRLDAAAADMRHTHDPVVTETQGTEPRHWLTEEAGYLKLTPSGDGVPLRVPLYAAPRPVAQMAAAVSSVNVHQPVGQVEIPLTGTGINTGDAVPVDIQSLAAPFELQITSPNEITSLRVEDMADIQYVGIATDAPSAKEGKSVEAATLFFAVVMYGDWPTPNAIGASIYIDVNQDQIDDYVLTNSNTGAYYGGDPNDVMWSLLTDLSEETIEFQGHVNHWSAAEFDTAVFQNNVMVLPAMAASLGLTSADATFTYRVETVCSIGYGQILYDQTDKATYNAAAPGMDFTNGMPGMPTFPDSDGNVITATYDRAALEANQTQGILLLHFHNGQGSRAEVVGLSTTSPLDVNRDGAVNAVDVQLVINGALGLETPVDTTDVNGDNATNAIDVQLVINGALGLA